MDTVHTSGYREFISFCNGTKVYCMNFRADDLALQPKPPCRRKAAPGSRHPQLNNTELKYSAMFNHGVIGHLIHGGHRGSTRTHALNKPKLCVYRLTSTTDGNVEHITSFSSYWKALLTSFHHEDKFFPLFYETRENDSLPSFKPFKRPYLYTTGKLYNFCQSSRDRLEPSSKIMGYEANKFCVTS